MKNLYLLLSGTHTQLFTGKLIAVLFLMLLVIAQASAQTNTTSPLDVSSLSFTPTVIDTSNSSQTVSVTVRVTDVITDVTRVTVGFRSATGNQFVSVTMNSQNRISGDSRDGVYQKEAIFPQYSKSGKWYVYTINVFDIFNYRNFYSSDFAARNFPTELQVISINEDVTPPEIVDFNLTPSFVDMTGGSRTVTVTVRAKDIQSEVRSVSVDFHRAGDDYLYGVPMNRISGDGKDGIYKGVITFSQYTESGTYGVFVYAYDTLGNSKSMNSEDLAKLGLPAALQIGAGTATTSEPTPKSRKRTRLF